MGIARDGGDALESEIEWFGLEAGLLKEWNNERTKAGVDVEWDLLSQRQAAETLDIVNDAMREVGGGSDKEDSVVVDQTGNSLQVDLEGDWIELDMVDLHLKVVASLVEGGMSRLWNDAVSKLAVGLIHNS